jgi:hypothetical protein
MFNQVLNQFPEFKTKPECPCFKTYPVCLKLESYLPGAGMSCGFSFADREGDWCSRYDRSLAKIIDRSLTQKYVLFFSQLVAGFQSRN